MSANDFEALLYDLSVFFALAKRAYWDLEDKEMKNEDLLFDISGERYALEEPTGDHPEFTRSNVVAFQIFLKELIEKIRKGETWEFETNLKHRVVFKNGRLSLLTGTALDYDYLIYKSLEPVQHRFHFCPECSKPFIKIKKMEYCSPECSQIGSTRKYRENNRDKFNKSRRDSYARKLQAELGKNVKVGTRKRKEVQEK
jgi:hypothetical protein